jgi:Ca2+:H+ antiporter
VRSVFSSIRLSQLTCPIVYGSYLVFQLQTHTSLYEGKDIPESTRYPDKHPKEKKSKEAMTSSAAHTTTDASRNDEEAAHSDEEAEEIPQLSIPVTVVLLVVVTAVRAHIFGFVDIADRFVSQLVAFTAEILVDSINGLVSGGKISKEFVGIILLPIVGNAAGTSVSLPITVT